MGSLFLKFINATTRFIHIQNPFSHCPIEVLEVIVFIDFKILIMI